MSLQYFTTDAEWETDAGAPDPIPPTEEVPELLGEFTLIDTKHLGPFDRGAATVFRTVWTWHHYEIQKEVFNAGIAQGLEPFIARASAPEIAGLGFDPEEKHGKLLKAQAKREGDRVVLDFSVEVDAGVLKSVLPMFDGVLLSNPTIPDDWKGKLGDFITHVRAATEGGAS